MTSESSQDLTDQGREEQPLDCFGLQVALQRIAPDLAKSSENVVALALRHLTDKEREFIVLRTKIGANAKSIRKRFGFDSDQVMRQRWEALMEIMRVLMIYFAKYDYRKAIAELKKQWLHPSRSILLDIFAGCPSDELAARHAMSARDLEYQLCELARGIQEIESEELRFLMMLIFRLYKFRRL